MHQEIYLLFFEKLAQLNPHFHKSDKQRVIYHLNRGVDIPHTLKIRKGDGTDRYAVAYRFYESEDLAEQAFQKIED
ncbi:MAG: hypothetical protein AAFR59_09005, partial [Bacteroidota bacterium]